MNTLRDHGRGRLVFGRFRLLRELGAGGMAVVWLAQDERLGLEVALKFLPGMVASDPEALHDLRREITRGLRLTHPGIVRLYDLAEDSSEGLAAITMEYVDGHTLADEKARQPDRCFDVADPLVTWTRELCDVLSYVHEKAKVVHRDLKPRNIMLTRAGELKVADFGIASTLSDSHSRLTLKMGSSGTPVYMSPQQALGRTPRPADDIYAIGATLYELLTSKPPFFRGNMAVILNQVAAELPTPMKDRREELGITGRAPIPAEWEEAIAACLAKNPEERPASVRELADRFGLHPAQAPRSTLGAVTGVPEPPAQVEPPAPMPAEEDYRPAQPPIPSENRPGLADTIAETKAIPATPESRAKPVFLARPVAPLSPEAEFADSPAPPVWRKDLLLVCLILAPSLLAILGAVWWSQQTPDRPAPMVQEHAVPGVKEQVRPVQSALPVVEDSESAARALANREQGASQHTLGEKLYTESERAEGAEKLRLLGEAEAAYRAALTVRTRALYPQDWAQTQHNLAKVLHDQGDRAEGAEGRRLLGEAEAANRAALEVRTREQLPQDWAKTQNNLGLVLWSRGRLLEGLEGLRLLGEAVTATRAALEVRAVDHFPTAYAVTQHNLGLILTDLGFRPDVSGSVDVLGEAAAAFRAALQVYSRGESPVEWAMAHQRLGVALREQARKTGGATGGRLVGEAVTAYRAALEVHTRAQFPEEWATTQHSLAIALADVGFRGTGAERPRLLGQAVAAGRAALEVRTRARLPDEWRSTMQNLATDLRTLAEVVTSAEAKKLRAEAEVIDRQLAAQP